MKDYSLKVNNLRKKIEENLKNQKEKNNYKDVPPNYSGTFPKTMIENFDEVTIKNIDIDTELLNYIDKSKIEEEFLIFINFFIPKLEGDFSFESSSVDSYLNYLNFISNTKGHKFTKFMYDIKESLRESNGIKIMQLIEILDKLS